MTITKKPNTYNVKINGLKISLLLCFLCFGFKGFCQTPSVVVSEYYNAADPRDEWTELIVINDNTDLRNFTFRDNNSDQTSPQPEITFTNISFWNNLRSGTIIIIWHRIRSSSVSTNRLVDTIKTDGYIEVHAQLSGYFSGGNFGSSPSWAGSSLTIAGGGELLQIRNSLTINEDALGHHDSSTAFFRGISGNNKLNHQVSSISSGDNVYVCPGGSISDFNQGVSGTTYTSKGSTNITQGLPNTCSTAPTQPNRTYWRSLRQPTYNSPTLNAITPNTAYTQLTLTWSACTDPNPIDSTTGYIILRNTTNSFTAPSDSVTYTNGNTIGTATVAGHINFSSTLAFIDNYVLNCNSIVYYKIYAFKYSTDNLNGNSYNAARGRAYNEVGTNVQSLTRPYPISQNIISN